MDGALLSELIARINRATPDGQDFDQAMSDALAGVAAGYLSEQDARDVSRAASAKLRAWDRELKREEMALRQELQSRLIETPVAKTPGGDV